MGSALIQTEGTRRIASRPASEATRDWSSRLAAVQAPSRPRKPRIRTTVPPQ